MGRRFKQLIPRKKQLAVEVRFLLDHATFQKGQTIFAEYNYAKQLVKLGVAETVASKPVDFHLRPKLDEAEIIS
jgi:hypothetical protein